MSAGPRERRDALNTEDDRRSPAAEANDAGRNQPSPAGDRMRSGQSADADRVAGAGPGDHVRLSPDAQLLGSAVRAASQTPDIRPDVVERARQKLAAGEVGRDVVRLADRMIDAFLSR